MKQETEIIGKQTYIRFILEQQWHQMEEVGHKKYMEQEVGKEKLIKSVKESVKM